MSNEKRQVKNERTTTSWREEPNVEWGMTWLPYTAHGPHSNDELAMLPTSVFAYPKHRQLALTDAEHVEWAIDQFWQVKEATDADREQAFLNLQEAAQHYKVQLPVDDWRMLPRISRQLPPIVQEDSDDTNVDDTTVKDLEETNSSAATD